MIRSRTDADLAACVVLLRAVHESAGYPVNWPADPPGWLNPPGALGCWVVTAGGALAGHVAVTATHGRASVERLFIDPRQGGRGLGRQLLTHALQVAASGGLPLELEVADNCEAAIRLYRRAGWQELGREPIGWGGTRASAVVRFAAPPS